MTKKTSPARPKTILFVDDEPSILSALRRLFRPHGYCILTAESGAAGLEILATQPVDLVISDMRMPEMDGTQFLEKVHEGWPDITRIFLTGYADINSSIDAISKNEIFCYIAKPWNDEEIVLTVRDAFERKRLQGECTRLMALQRKYEASRSAKWLLLALPPISLALTWISVGIIGWPSFQIIGERGIGSLLLYIFAIWSGLIVLLFAIRGRVRERRNLVTA